MTQVPMPNTCHPSLDHVAKAVRSSAIHAHTIQIPKLTRLLATFRDASDDSQPITEAFPVLTLVKKKCAGGAPYVGRRFMYQWWAWVADDGTNRAITSDAEAVYADSW